MDTTLDKLRALALAHAQGAQTATAVAGLTIWRSPCQTEPTPAMFDPKVYLVLQGAKRLHIGGQSCEYAAGGYSVSSLGMPFTGQVIQATPERPYLAVSLDLDARMLAELLLDMGQEQPPAVPAVAYAQAGEDIIEPLYRLVRLLAAADDVGVLAPLIQRELYYRLLQGPMGDILRQAMQSHTRFAQIRQAAEWICTHATDSMSVERIAGQIGMSVTSFHRHFKGVTGLSPLVYQRQVRLLHARTLLNADQASVTAVAYAVGYASASQFSREYARLFGCPPLRDTLRARQAGRTSAV